MSITISCMDGNPRNLTLFDLFFFEPLLVLLSLDETYVSQSLISRNKRKARCLQTNVMSSNYLYLHGTFGAVLGLGITLYG